jgi:hypothetical protein
VWISQEAVFSLLRLKKAKGLILSARLKKLKQHSHRLLNLVKLNN